MECLDCTNVKAIHGSGLCLLHKRKLLKARAFWKANTKKWRQANPERARELSRQHQATWRNKHPDLNRLRSKLGMAKLKQRRLSK